MGESNLEDGSTVAQEKIDLREGFEETAASIHTHAVESLFTRFEDLCEGAVAVDREARIVWINEKYRALLGLPEDESVVGRAVEELIPHSLMREVVTSGRPIPLDIMQFGERWFVVTRIPLKDEKGTISGAIGFVLYDKVDYLKPLMTKFMELRAALKEAERQLTAQRRPKYGFSQFVGRSPKTQEVKRLARRAAQLDTTIMLLGETGTGKELLAHAIHAASMRAERPFIGINVAAVPETLLEAEFFGVAPGAYTGADRKGRDGKFKLADGGTLFLDEVGDMPVHVQAKLLRALQEQEIEPLGSNKVLKVDVRVIAASSRDVKKLVDDGEFRADLYFRLNVLPIEVPPLRARVEDLDLLCEVMLEQIAARTGEAQRELEPSAMAVLSAHRWPGNVRELRNVLERACMLSDGPSLNDRAFVDILPPGVRAEGPDQGTQAAVRPLDQAVEEVERSAILAALRATRGKKAPAAKLLGISRSKLYDKLQSYHLLSGNPT